MAADRPKNQEVEQENARPDGVRSGRPPRPATEPGASKASTQSPKLRTDPGSGEAKRPD